EVSPEGSLFTVLDGLPLGGVFSVIAIVLVVLFFITSSDSGSLVQNMLTAGGHPTRQPGLASCFRYWKVPSPSDCCWPVGLKGCKLHRLLPRYRFPSSWCLWPWRSTAVFAWTVHCRLRRIWDVACAFSRNTLAKFTICR